MPIPAEHIKDATLSPSLLWFINQTDYNKSATGSIDSYLITDEDSPIYHSLNHKKSVFENTNLDFRRNSTNKEFVVLESQFSKQFSLLSDYFDGVSFETAKSLMQTSLSLLLEIDPDAIKLELTPEKSIFYTVKKDNYTFYIQHFLDIDKDECDDEGTLTAFINNRKLPSYAGNLDQILNEIREKLSIGNTVNFKLELHELSE